MSYFYPYFDESPWWGGEESEESEEQCMYEEHLRQQEEALYNEWADIEWFRDCSLNWFRREL